AVGGNNKLLCPEPAPGIDHHISNGSCGMVEDYVADLAQLFVVPSIEMRTAYIFSRVGEPCFSQDAVVCHFFLLCSCLCVTQKGRGGGPSRGIVRTDASIGWAKTPRHPPFTVE